MSSTFGQNPRTLAQLQRLPVSTQIKLLEEALLVAQPSEAEPLGLALIELATEYSEAPNTGSRFAAALRRFFGRLHATSSESRASALQAVIRMWSRLPAPVQVLAAAAGKGRWAGVLGPLATAQESSTRRAVADLARGAGDASLASIAAELLTDQDESVASAAESALVFLALVASDPAMAAWSDHASLAQHEEASRVRARWEEADRQRVMHDVASALRALATHRREGVLWGALLLLEPRVTKGGGPLAKWVHDREQSSHAFLRGLLRRDHSPLSRLRAWQWLGTTAISNASADRVLSASTLDEHEALFGTWHLVRNPARLARLEKAVKASKAELLPPTDITPRLSADGRFGVAAIADSARIDAQKRDSACEPMLVDPEPFVRLGIAQCCSTRMLVDVCFDPEPVVARSAALRLSMTPLDGRLSPGAERVAQERSRLATLCRSPHFAVRTLARDDLESLCGGRTLSVVGRVAFQRAIVADRAWVIEHLRELMGIGEEERSFALMMGRRLGIVSELKTPLISSVRAWLREQSERTPRSIATAVASLRQIEGDEPLQLLQESARSSDQRVRSNAIDTMVSRLRSGLDRDSAKLTSTLLEFKEDPWHRVRGSAVRGLEQLQSAPGVGGSMNVVGEQLLSMLEDARPQHRLAGTWVADRTLPTRSLRELKLWPALIARLRSLALTDLETRVRARARLALARAGEEPVKGPGGEREEVAA